MARSPQIQSGIDPVGMLTAAFNQTPNYLGWCDLLLSLDIILPFPLNMGTCMVTAA
jgi:hypothetical protein